MLAELKFHVKLLNFSFLSFKQLKYSYIISLNISVLVTGDVEPTTVSFRPSPSSLHTLLSFSLCEQMAKQADLFFLCSTLDHTQ